MNKEFLKLVRMECFKAWPAEALKIYFFLVEDAIACRDRVSENARANGILCCALRKEDIANYFGWTVETVQAALVHIGTVGLVRRERYSGCDIFKLGEINNGKIVWNTLKDYSNKGKKEVTVVPQAERDSIMEAIRLIQCRKREGIGLAEKARKRVVGDIFGEQVVVVEKKVQPLSSIPLDRFTDRYFEKYSSYPSGATSNSGKRTFTGELRVYAKKYMQYHENDEVEALAMIDFAFDNAEKVAENLIISQPLEPRNIFVKSSVTKLRRWMRNGFPNKQGMKKNEYLDRYSGDDWSVPGSLS